MPDSKPSSTHHSQKHSQAKRQYMHNRYPSTNEVTGPGIFVTCPRGREGPSFQEVIAALGSCADELYPRSNAEAGPSSSASQPVPDTKDFALAPIIAPDDIEARLKREISELTGGSDDHRGVKRKIVGDSPEEDDSEVVETEEVPAGKRAKIPNRESDEKTRNPKRKKKASLKGIDARFSHGDLETSSSFFVACKSGIDPVELVYNYLLDVEKTGISRTRQTQRLVPINRICKADLPSLIELVQDVVEERFGAIAKELGKEKEGDNPLTYRIEFRERKTSRLKKIDVLNAAGTMAPGWKVALEGSDVVIAVEVYKMSVGVGILRDYERLKKYNVEAITKAFLEKAAAAKDDEATARLETATKEAKPAVKLWQGNVPEEGAYDFAREVELEDGEVKRSLAEKERDEAARSEAATEAHPPDSVA